MVPGERYCDMYRRIEGNRGVPIGAHERKIGVPEGDVFLTNELAMERIVLRHGMESGEERDLVELLIAREVSGSNANDTVTSFLDATVHVAIPFAGNHADRKEHHPRIEAETRVLKNMVFLDSASSDYTGSQRIVLSSESGIVLNGLVTHRMALIGYRGQETLYGARSSVGTTFTAFIC